MSAWQEIKIDDLKSSAKNAIAMGPFGSRIKAENFVSHGIPVIKGGNLNDDFLGENEFDFLTEEKADELMASNAFRGDLVITHRGTIGQVGIIPWNSKYERYVVSQSQLKVTLDQKKMNPYFLYYFFKSSIGQHRLLMNSSQVGVPAIAKASTSVKAIKVPCPRLDVQNKIVNHLFALDNKITLNRQINQTLEAMAQALFKSWFVNFEPVKAKMSVLAVGGSTDDANLAAMSAISGKTTEQLLTLKTSNPDQYQQLYTTADLFPSEMVDSELGEIPKGWEVVGFEKIAQPKKGKNITKSTVIEGDVPVVAGGLEPAYYHNTPNVFSPVITVSASGANAGYVNLYHNDIWASDCSYISKGQTSYVYSVYCFLKLKQKEIYDMQQGAAQPHVYPKDLHRLKLATPESLALWLKLEELIMPFFSMIKNNTQEMYSLTQSRDTLLPKLLSGELLVDGVSE